MESLHRFGELIVAANVRIPGLYCLGESSTLKFDVRVTQEEGIPVVAEEVLFRWPGRYGLTLGRLGSEWVFSTSAGAAFLVRSGGRDVRVYWSGSGSKLQVWDAFVRRVMPRIALMFGRKAMHAAALGGQRGAALLLGSSHAGKSTLAAAAVQWAKCTPLSDDVSIWTQEGAASVSPAASGLCLWPDSRTALELPDDSCRAMPGYEEADGKGKVWFEPALADTPKTQVLKALVTLTRSPDSKRTHIEQLEPAEGIFLASRQTVRFNPAAISPENAAQQLQDLASLVVQVPAYRLTYSSEYQGLHSAVDSLMQLI